MRVEMLDFRYQAFAIDHSPFTIHDAKHWFTAFTKSLTR
jgi:hypothetical protein